MRRQSLKARLEALERLEAQRQAERGGADPLPDVARLSDGAALSWVLDGLRGGQLHTWHDQQGGKLWLCVTGQQSVEWEMFYQALVRCAQPFVDARYAAIHSRILPNSDGRAITAAVIGVLEEVATELLGYPPIDWDLVPRDLTEAFADERVGLDAVLAYLQHQRGAMAGAGE